MDIQYAILGLLSWQSFSGYDIKKIIADSDLFYWSGNNNQIYNSLIQMHKDGLVTQSVQQQESLPAKKIYAITEAGRTALRQWALAAPELPELRSGFLIQLAWVEQLSDAEVDHLLAQYEEEVAVQLRMRQVAKESSAPDRSPRERYLWRKISGHRIGAYQQELDWVREVRKALKARTFDEE